MYSYSYLLGDTALLVIWLLLFLFRKDVRREMLFLSIIFGMAGIFVQYVHTVDWWRPSTITNTRIGIEDFLFGWGIGGVSSVLYEEIFKRKLYPKRSYARGGIEGFFALILLAALFFGSFYILKLHSFHASVFALGLATLFIWLRRRDLVVDSLLTGFLLTAISFLFYLPEYINPGWIQHAWVVDNLSGITFLRVPPEDILWYFFAGIFIGPLYEFWKGARLRKIEQS